MKIAVFGSGGVGGYFGARLAQAGEDVTFIARGAHLDALRQNGIAVRTPAGDFAVGTVRAAADPAAVGPVDYVLFAIKLYDTEAGAEACRPLVGPETAVVNLQNGVDGEAVLARVLGERSVLPGTCYISSTIAAPGVVAQTGTFARLLFAERDGSPSARVDRLAEACRKAGIDVTVPDDIEQVIWMKFLILSAMAAMTTLTRLPAGPLRADPDTRAMFQELVAEAAAVARAQGVGLPSDAVARQMATLDGFPADMVASMLNDLRAGKPLELDGLSGAVVRLGRASGVATPTHECVWRALKLFMHGTPAQG